MFDYQAQQPDELDLQRGDVVKVYRKMADGKTVVKNGIYIYSHQQMETCCIGNTVEVKFWIIQN